jgi:hypothetical protein
MIAGGRVLDRRDETHVLRLAVSENDARVSRFATTLPLPSAGARMSPPTKLTTRIVNTCGRPSSTAVRLLTAERRRA